MWFFRRIDPFRLFSGFRFVTSVGGGGKTTLGEYLARAAQREGRRAAATTTTKIRASEPYVLFDDLHAYHDREGFTRVGKSVMEGKLTPLTFDEVEKLGTMFDFITIEADGAKGRPLKYPSATEPVIPPFSDHTIVVAGLDGLGGRVAEQVFRWELFRDAAGVPGDALVDRETFETLFGARAMMKDVAPDKCTILLNKYELCQERERILPLARDLMRVTGVPRVVISSLFLGIFYGISET